MTIQHGNKRRYVLPGQEGKPDPTLATAVTQTNKPFSQRFSDEEMAAARTAPRANLQQPARIEPRTNVDASLRAAGFGARHINKRGWKPWNPNDAMQRVLVRLGEGATIGVAGNFGRGKTQMACEVCRAWIESGKGQPLYMTAATLMERLKAAWNGEGDDPRKSLRRTPLLVVDDIQNEYHTDTWRVEFGNFMDYRYANLLPTMLIANWTKADFAKNVGQRITSRISEGGGIIELGGNDRRQEGAA